MRGFATETNSPFATWFSMITQTLRGELAARKTMNNRINNECEQLDHRTCRSICDAVGERLQQNIRPEPALSPHLQHLVDELHRRHDEPR